MNLWSLQEREFKPQRHQQPVVLWVKTASHQEVANSTAQLQEAAPLKLGTVVSAAIPTLRRLKREDPEFKVSPGYIRRLSKTKWKKEPRKCDKDGSKVQCSWYTHVDMA